MIILEYFGTQLDCAGHYFFTLTDNGFMRSELSKLGWDKLPFNPETIFDNLNDIKYITGKVVYDRINGYTICAIVGSCFDKRHGCKSVFFTNEKDVKFGDMKYIILANNTGKKIVDQMTFTIDWGIKDNYDSKYITTLSNNI